MTDYRAVLQGNADPALIAQLVASGVLNQQSTPERRGSNEGGEFVIPAATGYAFAPGQGLTKFGGPNDFRLYDQPSGQASGGFKLRNPNLIYNDPNFGWITPATNTIDPSKQKNFYDLIGPLVMSAVLGGAGAGLFGTVGAGQGLALGAAQGVRSGLGGGNWGSILGSILGGQSGVPFGSGIGGLAGGMLTPNRAPPQQPMNPQQMALLAQLMRYRP